MKIENFQKFMLGAVVMTACLALLAIVGAPYFNVTMPNDIKTFVFGLILTAVGAGGGATLWTAAERRGEIRGEVAASNALLAQGLGAKARQYGAMDYTSNDRATKG